MNHRQRIEGLLHEELQKRWPEYVNTSSWTDLPFHSYTPDLDIILLIVHRVVIKLTRSLNTSFDSSIEKYLDHFISLNSTPREVISLIEFALIYAEPNLSFQSEDLPPLPPLAAPPMRLRVLRRPKTREYHIVPIFYGTDREKTGSSEPNDYYGNKGGNFEYGMCEVSIPKTHTRGKLERPSWWRLEFNENPEKHITLLKIKSVSGQRFFKAVADRVNKSDEKDAFVFIHGFNVAFAEAARRTGQLAYDLGFKGAPILYSWPSRAAVPGYIGDLEDAELTTGNLRAFLVEIASKTNAKKIHVIAHSMGNRALTYALRELRMSVSALPVFNQIILTAPDIDARIFERQIVPAIRGIAERITLYASSADKALAISKAIRGYPRAGDSGEALVVIDGIDTIDASEVETDALGHGYFAETAPLINDIFLLLRHGLGPDERNLPSKEKKKLKYWFIPKSV